MDIVINTHIPNPVNRHAHTYMHVSLCICMYIHVYYQYTHIYIYTHFDVYTNTRVCRYVGKYVCGICVIACMYMWVDATNLLVYVGG